MKNGIFIYEGVTRLITADDNDFMKNIYECISVKSGVVDIDVPCKDNNYRLIINDGYFEEDELVKNIEASKISKNRDIYGPAVLIKVINNFDSGMVDDIVEMSADEIKKYIS